MLLFIEQEKILVIFISRVSIHLMLLFITIKKRKCGSRKQVSIHLMLLFIKHWLIDWSKEFQCFNTSHVIVYLTILRHFSFSSSRFIPYSKAFSFFLPAFFQFFIFHLFTLQSPYIS